VFKGGGRLNRTATSALNQESRVVDMLDPRPSTASIVDGPGICGRLKQVLYTAPLQNGGLRQRCKNKEIQPPIR
jgi:hypothetical protein